MTPAPSDRWSRKLPRAVTDRNGRKLRTYGEARAYILALPEWHQCYEAWQHAAEFLMESDDAAAVAHQLERALFMDMRLMLK